MSRNPMLKAIPLIAIAAVLLISGNYITGILSTTSDTVNVTNTSFEKPYESNVKIQAATLELLSPITLICFIGVLIMAVVWLRNSKRY
jgi:hypothetical protein